MESDMFDSFSLISTAFLIRVASIFLSIYIFDKKILTTHFRLFEQPFVILSDASTSISFYFDGVQKLKKVRTRHMQKNNYLSRSA